MRWYALTLAASATLAGAFAAAADEEMVTNPSYREWSGFKPGTTVVRKMVVQTHPSAEAAPEHRAFHREWIHLKLLETTPEKVVLEEIVTEGNRGHSREHAPVKVTYPAKVRKSDVQSEKSELRDQTEGEESIDVNGKSLKSHWVETTMEDDGTTSTQKVWLSRDVPGGLVKEVHTRRRGNTLESRSTTELVKVETR